MGLKTLSASNVVEDLVKEYWLNKSGVWGALVPASKVACLDKLCL